MYTVSYSSDIIRGSNNFGESYQMTDVTEAELNRLINELNTACGEPKDVCGMKLWLNEQGDTFTISVFVQETK